MFDYYSQDGVTLMVEFKCMRKGCNTTYLGPLEQHMCRDEGARYLHNLLLPKGWSRHWCSWLLCPSCTAHIQNFLREGEIDI
jgi:hypothetical protein